MLTTKPAVLAIGVVLIVFSAVAVQASQANLQRWVKQLSSKKVAERVEAAERLGRADSEDAAAPLGAALSDPERVVRVAAASALWRLGEKGSPAAAQLQSALEDSDLEVVVAAAGALESQGVDNRRLAPARQRALRSSDMRIRFEAARGLIGYEPAPALVPAIVDFLEREAQRGEDMSADFGTRDAARANARRAERALQRLVATQEQGLAQYLLSRLGRDGAAQAALLEAAGGLKVLPSEWDAVLARGMASANPRTRGAAAGLAARRLQPEQVAVWLPAAIRLLGDADESVRGSVLLALRSAGGLAASATPLLAARLAGEPDPNLRQRVAEVMGAVGDRNQPVAASVKAEVAAAARPALERAVAQDSQSMVRREAVKSLDLLALPGEEAVALLARIAQQSRDDEVVWQALQALRNRGREAAPVLAAIQELRGHASPQVAEYASTIARELESDLAGPPGVAGRPAQPVAEARPRVAKVDPAAEARGLAVLRQRGAQLNESTFQRALMAVDAELVSALLDAGMSASHSFAEVNARQPLHLLFFFPAACSSAVRPTPAATHAVLDLLLERGADPNGQDEAGNTPLMFAADKCDAAVMGKLLKAGAKHDARNAMGMAALEMAIWSGNDGLQALIDAGARLEPNRAAAYAEAYKNNPQALELIRRATAKK